MNEKSVLLASFIRREHLSDSLNFLMKTKKVLNNRIFVLRDSKDDNKLILTYNIVLKENEKINFKEFLDNTVSLHRKKETNTLYTLNGLNEVVKFENNDKLDKNFLVDWDKYRNCIILNSKFKGFVKINTILESIKNFNNRRGQFEK